MYAQVVTALLALALIVVVLQQIMLRFLREVLSRLSDKIVWLEGLNARQERVIAARTRTISRQSVTNKQLRTKIALLEEVLEAHRATFELIECEYCGLTLLTFDGGRSWYNLLRFSDGEVQFIKAYPDEVDEAREHVELSQAGIMVMVVLEITGNPVGGMLPLGYIAPGQMVN